MNKSSFDLINSKAKIGIGFVIVPTDIDRDRYIMNCFLKETVSFYPEEGGLAYHNAKLVSGLIQDIMFPTETSSFGSTVLYYVHPIYRYPIVFGLLDRREEAKLLEWGQFKISKSYRGAESLILGNGKKGSLLVKVQGNSKYNGKIAVQVIDSETRGSLDLQVQGSLSIISSLISVLTKDFEIVSSNSLKCINNTTTFKTLNLNIECLEERDDIAKESIPEDLETGVFSLTGKTLHLKVGSTEIEISDTEDPEGPQILINKGKKGGLINIKDQEAKLNELVDTVNKLVNQFNNHIHTTPSGPSSPITTPVSEASKFNSSDYEDIAVLH